MLLSTVVCLIFIEASGFIRFKPQCPIADRGTVVPTGMLVGTIIILVPYSAQSVGKAMQTFNFK